MTAPSGEGLLNSAKSSIGSLGSKLEERRNKLRGVKPEETTASSADKKEGTLKEEPV